MSVIYSITERGRKQMQKLRKDPKNSEFFKALDQAMADCGFVEVKQVPGENPCPYLELVTRPASGEVRYRCEWCEEGMMRKCNVWESRDQYWCPLDEFGNTIEWEMGNGAKSP